MKSLYESILDTDVLDKADEGAQRLLTVLKTARILVDELDIVRANSDDDPGKASFMPPIYFHFRPQSPMASDAFKTIRRRLDQFEKRAKNELGLIVSINTTRKRTAMSNPASLREYGLKQSYDISCQYDIKFFDKDNLLLGYMMIKVSQYEVSRDIHDASIRVDLKNKISNQEWYKALLDQMDKNK